MLEPLKGKRAIFPKGRQTAFLMRSLKRLDLSWLELARKIKVDSRTLNNWKREKHSIPLIVVQKICKITNTETPMEIEIRNKFWYTKKGGEIAGKLVYEKYGTVGGDPKRRKRKWLQWWDKEGKFNLPSCFVAKGILKPRKNVELAEFVGIMIGDGGITERQVTVTLNCITDKEYVYFVSNLVKKLFGVESALYKRERDSTMNIVVSRTKLSSFCKSVGLKIGNKLAQNLDIPSWIKRNKNFSIACIRGLIDTDGCVFNECHNINSRKYCYPHLSLVSASESLRLSVSKILSELGFRPKIHNNRSVQLDSREDVIKYFQLIGTSNTKHKRRFRNMMGRVG